MTDETSFEDRVFGIIADTFSLPPGSVVRATTADDVAGWDSLGHSILLARLSNKLGIDIGEEIASNPHDAGELADVLAKARREAGGG